VADPVRVVVGVGDYLVREGLVRALEGNHEAEVVSICSSLKAVRAATDDEHPDVVVTTLRLAPRHTDEGVRLAAQLRRTHPEVGVVVLGEPGDSQIALSLFKPDASKRAYVLREQIHNSRELIRAVHEVASGRSLIDPTAIAGMLPRAEEAYPASLTAREHEILSLVAEAESNVAIARSLGITTRAVERHINSIFRKLGLTEAEGLNRRVKAALVFAGKSNAAAPEDESSNPGRHGVSRNPRHHRLVIP
jgi:DNA-binding NarL/FixJ family response regulator